METLGKHFLTFILLAVICYTGLLIFCKGQNLWVALIAFPFNYLPLLLALAIINYLLRYARWHIYIKNLGTRTGHWMSFKIFMAGLTMTFTPGKVGESLKAYLLKREGDNPWSEGLSIVFAERLTDLVGVVILVVVGLGFFPFGKSLVLFGTAVCLFLILLFVHPNLFKGVLRYLGKLPWIAKRIDKLLAMHESVKHLMGLRLMLVSISISCVAWFAECLTLYFALSALQSNISWLLASFIYALSTLAGALSIFPGGVIVTEGSMTGLLILYGSERNQAVLATLAVRLCTLWFAIFLGIIFLFFLRKKNATITI